jgi:hypothetical protein
MATARVPRDAAPRSAADRIAHCPPVCGAGGRLVVIAKLAFLLRRRYSPLEARRTLATVDEPHAHAAGVGDDVIVGDDAAVCIEAHPGAHPLLGLHRALLRVDVAEEATEFLGDLHPPAGVLSGTFDAHKAEGRAGEARATRLVAGRSAE